MKLEWHWINGVTNGAKRNENSFLFPFTRKLLERKDDGDEEEEEKELTKDCVIRMRSDVYV